MIFLQDFIMFDQGISEKCVGQTFDGRKKERIRRIIIRTRNDMIWKIINGSQFQKNDDGYQFARTKSTWKPNVAQIGWIFVFWRPFWIQNGRHSKPKWSPYGAVCLTLCNYLFLLKSLNFWIFNNLFLFYFFLYRRPFWKF